MRLYLMRHGHAVPAHQDPSRPLSGRGRDEVDAMGRAAASDLAHLTRVLCSTKTRAQETARRLVEAAGLSVQPTHTAGLLPADSTEAWVTRVEDEVEDLILVGHNPFMEDLLSNLCGSSEAFDTATLACLERQEDGRFQLAWIRRPADLG